MSKLSKRLLSWLLLAAMLCTLLPTAVFAEDADVLEPAEDTVEYDAVTGEQLSPDTDEPETYALDEGLEAQTVADSGEFYRIVHLDCGRKYFTKDWIIALINEMAEDGYNQLQLAFGNDGLRFLLDDMSITVGDTTYDSASVTAGIQAGNLAYNASMRYTTETNELTEAEMNEIIAHAQTKGIEIVPMLNMPGHMDAVLDAIEYVGIADAHAVGTKTTSTRSLNLNNENAIAFAQAFLEKYVAYFAGKGCKFFHIGADEYCNNGEYKNGQMGFEAMGATLYGVFAEFVNNAAATVKEYGMTSRAWNDGINYGSYSSNFDSEIQVTYWSSGWSGYNVAYASTLSGKGHQMINTNGDFYYILGKSDNFDSGYSYASNFSNTAFARSTISNPVGSMFCIWCDEPGAETEQQVAQKARLPLRAMALRMQDQGIAGMSTDVVSGGFNADGSLNTESVGGDNGDNGESGDNTTPEISYGSELTGGNTLTAGATTTLSLGNGKTATWVSSDTGVISLTSAEEVSTMAVSEGITATSVTAQAVGAGTATVTATPEGGTAVTLAITVPQAADNNGTATGETKEVYVGATTTIEIDGSYSEATSSNEGIAKVEKVESGNAMDNITQVDLSEDGTYTGYIGCNGQYLKIEDGEIKSTEEISEATEFTVGSSVYNAPYKITCSINEQTKYLIASYSKKTWSLSLSDDYPWFNSWSYSSDGGFYKNEYSNNGYLTCTGNTWSVKGTNIQNHAHLYQYTPGTNKTVVTVTGVEEGNTSVTVGDKTYPIEVKRYEKTVNMVVNTTSSAYKQNYVGNGNVTYSKEGIVTAMVDKNAKTVTFTALKVGTTTVTVGDTKYTVTVTEEDLSKVTSKTLEYWITNVQATYNGDNYKTITASDVHSEDGKLISELAPGTTYKDSTTKLTFWQGRYHTDEKQTTGSGVDKTQAGAAMVRIRYWNGNWAYQDEDGKWNDIADDAQLVAYYLQVTDVTDEVTTAVVDWGVKKKDNYKDVPSNEYVLVDYSVKYEDGTVVPSSFPTANTLGFHCTFGSNNENKDKTVFDDGSGNQYRRIGAIKAVNSDAYEVYLITVTPTADYSSSTISDKQDYSYSGTEKVVWAETEADYENSGLDKYTSISGTFTYSYGGEPVVPGIEIYNRHGMKITYYVRTKPAETNLTVHYMDGTEGAATQFYQYDIAVVENTMFTDAKMPTADDEKGVVATVTNVKNVRQEVPSNLNYVPQAAAKYRYAAYSVTNVTLSEDKKELYIYYTFDNTVNFVVDFGLPLEITKQDLYTELATDAKLAISGSSQTTYGKAEVNADGNIVYTPTSVLTGYDTFTVSVTVKKDDGEDDTVGYIVNIYPANNVLYEETFATVDENSGWKQVDTANANTTQKVSGDDDVYGYDAAYAKNNDKYSNGSAYKATVVTSGEKPKATFSFKGDGLEVISECGPQTGGLYIRVTNALEEKNADGTVSYFNRVYIVDTYFNGTLVSGSSEVAVNDSTLYQVPVVHALGLADTDHDVTVYAYNIPKKLSTANAQVAVQLASDGTESMSYGSDLDAILAEMGDEGAEVEYISMNEVLGGSDDGVSLYATQVYDANETSDDLVVYLDGFRVYNTLDTEPSAYVEQDAEFTSLYDIAAESYWNDTDKNGQGLVYVENAGEKETTHSAYKNSGPQNEIYIGANQAIAFKVTEGVTNVQVSAKAIKGEPTLKTNGEKISTQTEMYYNVDVQDNGIVVIQNTTEGTILSLVDLKIIGGTVDTQSTITADQVEAAIYNLQNPKPAEPDDSGNTGDAETPSKPEDGNTGNGETPSKPEDGNTGNGETPSKPEGGNTGNGETPNKPEGGNTGNSETPSKPDSGNTGDADKPEDPEESWQNPFKDVDMKAWYAPAIRYLSSRGIVNGLPGGIFGTENDTTRSMVITMLYRLADSPKVEGEIPFDDVPEEAWYADAALWAYQTGIVKGYAEGNNLLFKPDQAITRQEFVTMLYRFVTDYKKMTVSLSSDLNTYGDKNQVQPWAQDAMKWAVDNGIMNGYNEGKNWFLKPTNKTKRSEMAKLFYGLYGYLGQN